MGVGGSGKQRGGDAEPCAAPPLFVDLDLAFTDLAKGCRMLLFSVDLSSCFPVFLFWVFGRLGVPGGNGGAKRLGAPGDFGGAIFGVAPN